MTAANRSVWTKQNGQWVAVNVTSIGVDGAWADMSQGYVKVNGQWQQFYPASGSVTFNTPGTYTWVVPPGVFTATLNMAGGGGGGAGSTEVGNGGGGGGGGGAGFVQNESYAVTPGETITIQVGAGGGGGGFIGRTTEPPPGADGASSSVTGTGGTRVVSGGHGGASPTYVQESGGKIICTKLYELGLLSKNIYEADQAFGAELVKRSPDIYNGYRAWAEIVVDWMEGRGPNMMPWLGEQGQGYTQQWAISWATDIATPWATEMAFVMGKLHKGSLTGKLIAAIGAPICKIVGVWQRIVGPSKTQAGFIKGLLIIPVFIVLKLVASLGKGK